jgi:hypothetical protein
MQKAKGNTSGDARAGGRRVLLPASRRERVEESAILGKRVAWPSGERDIEHGNFDHKK